jgi:hypothetical protein
MGSPFTRATAAAVAGRASPHVAACSNHVFWFSDLGKIDEPDAVRIVWDGARAAILAARSSLGRDPRLAPAATVRHVSARLVVMPVWAGKYAAQVRIFAHAREPANG